MTKPSYYVGIGASAGGLEAIETFFKQMPPDSGLGFVVVQHLSPDYKSLMAELLSKHTRMPVLRTEDGMQVQANHVYLIPPKKNLTMFHGKLLLSDQDPNRGINLPIDIYLRSLAEDQGEKAIAVILSGTGSDGTRGIRSIKEQGGMIMAQSEESAKFDGMPKSVINTGLADFILPPEDMPKQLLAFVKHPYVAKAERAAASATDEDGLTRIFALLRGRSKLDFTYYKPSTVLRRIERRMTVNQFQELREYVRFLERFPTELDTLYRELLIGVTSFFRDKAAWECLAGEILPAMIQNNGKRELRLWVAGCSSGEEAYSLAMISREVMESLGVLVDVKIFATDVDRDAVQRAGAGVYPESIVADMPPQMLSKYFQRKDDNFHIARPIREMVVFACHNLLKDPPFTNIDLITCRNLLIYLQPVLQKKTLDLFSFSLNPEGVLFLGTSETIGDAADVYQPINQKWRLYRAKGKRRLSESHELIRLLPRAVDTPLLKAGPHGPVRINEDDRLLGRLVNGLSPDYIPLALVINQQMELLHVVGDASGILQLPSGRVQNEITHLATRDLAIPLATGLQKVFRSGNELEYTNIHVQERGQARVINLRIRPLPAKKGYEPLAVALLEPVDRKATEPASVESYDLDREAEQRIHDLESELQFTRENLQATVEELETSNEELQAANEELLASNEELQSTNEELQSVNEELYTVNAEYQTKIGELSQLNNDLDNLIAATELAILFLDDELRVRRYTPALTRLFRIADADIGREMTDLGHQLIDIDLPGLARSVQTRRAPADNEVRTRDGRWFLLQARPYRIGREPSDSLVLNFLEITALKRAQEEIASSQERHALAQQAAKSCTWDWDIVAGKLLWSDTAELVFGRRADTFAGTLDAFLDHVCREDREPLRRQLFACLEKGSEYDIEHRIVLPDGNIRWIAQTGSVHRDSDGRAVRMLGVARNIHERKLAQLALKEDHVHYRRLFDEAPHLIFLLDPQGTIVETNAAAQTLLEHEGESLHGAPAKSVFPDEAHEDLRVWLEALNRGEPLHARLSVLVSRSGQRIPIEISAVPEQHSGRVTGSRAVARDMRTLEAAKNVE